MTNLNTFEMTKRDENCYYSEDTTTAFRDDQAKMQVRINTKMQVDHGRDETRRRAGEADAATRKRSLEAGELLVARKHGAPSVAGRRREMEDTVSVREAFALAEGWAGEADAATRKRSLEAGELLLEAGELLVARKHGAASVAGRRMEMEDAVSVRETFALAEGSHGGRRDFYGMHELLAEELAVAAADVSWTARGVRAGGGLPQREARLLRDARAARRGARCRRRRCLLDRARRSRWRRAPTAGGATSTGCTSCSPRSSLSPPTTSPGPRRWSAAPRGWTAR
ncbi:uncharacterized protein LOC110432288 [Sorghum bicolor]|uniref:uncharacterized protein LOC110432288 n=1 Tax=Sorghum bicolor TaxID=4558 RepID=UPI000B426788|nr:uncharacterized protein LOC110432288 [Sorghum bicolor]|eukprot:XP_021308071.1 uncharacterized protein LOC110432288 [Sorghum bicolor]